MTYTRRALEKIQRSPVTTRPVLEELLAKLEAKKPMTLSEEDFVCSMARILRKGQGEYMYDITELKGCVNFRFRTSYPMFANDLEGRGPIRSYYGFWPENHKAKEVQFLHEVYKDWEATVRGRKTGDPLTDDVIDEVDYQAGLLDRFCRLHKMPDYQKKDIYKWLILKSKYI